MAVVFYDDRFAISVFPIPLLQPHSVSVEQFSAFSVSSVLCMERFLCSIIIGIHRCNCSNNIGSKAVLRYHL